MAEEGPWTIVTKKNRKKLLDNEEFQLVSYSNPLPTQDLSSVIKKLDKGVSEMDSDPFLECISSCIGECLASLHTTSFSQIVCYGLGNFSASSISLHQLSLLISLAKLHPTTQISLFDPIFTDLEKRVLTKELGYTLIAVNEDCKKIPTNLTLFYMPHCEHTLMDNLISVNWDNLENILVFGNRFAGLPESDVKKLEYLNKAIPKMYEIIPKVRFEPNLHTFNDMACMTFPF